MSLFADAATNTIARFKSDLRSGGLGGVGVPSGRGGVCQRESLAAAALGAWRRFIRSCILTRCGARFAPTDRWSRLAFQAQARGFTCESLNRSTRLIAQKSFPACPLANAPKFSNSSS